MNRISRLLLTAAVPLAVVALVVAGCGGDSGDNVKAGSSAASINASSGGGGAATLRVRSGDLGKFVVDSQGHTLYLFEKDTGSKSMCNGACASAWPPSTVTGTPKAGSGVDSHLLGTTKRSDGTTQVTYAGHPLYRYAGDQAPGDTNGQDLDQFGGSWYVVSPSGKWIEKDGSGSDMGGGSSVY